MCSKFTVSPLGPLYGLDFPEDTVEEVAKLLADLVDEKVLVRYAHGAAILGEDTRNLELL